MVETTRRGLLAGVGMIGLAAGLGALPRRVRASERPLLQVGAQDAALPEIIRQSGVLEDAPFDVKWAVLTGPAAQLQALYAQSLDVGLMGDTSLIIEQGKAREEWTAETAPLQIVAGWRNPDPAYPPIVTVVSKASGIQSLADLKGKRWSYNFGGFNYLQYKLSHIKAGLTEKDFSPVKLGDGNLSAAAFVSGQVDAYSGMLGPVKALVDRGEASILVRSDELEIPARTVFTARGDVIRDEAKSAVLADFLARVRLHWDWHAANLPAVEQIWIDKGKQTPERAAYSARNGISKFYPLDDALVAQEQKIADTLFESGDIPKRIDVSVEYSRKYNPQTVGTA
ncbi:ABC transporter substrate-binding protein [Zavarzinia sp. CC-PAN008]|uniref:ABC transporter substrate-binding protein n=1 Tax=Zavarzinia sp. CC-PAN008 TaxID=3243332 RepID=UPI003F7451CF